MVLSGLLLRLLVWHSLSMYVTQEEILRKLGPDTTRRFLQERGRSRQEEPVRFPSSSLGVVTLFKRKLFSLTAGPMRFTGEEFRSLCGPLVYVFWQDTRALYVGMSSESISRPASRDHDQAGARSQCTEVLIFPTPSAEAANELELLLITALQPSLNKRRDKGSVAGCLGLTPMDCVELAKDCVRDPAVVLSDLHSRIDRWLAEREDAA